MRWKYYFWIRAILFVLGILTILFTFLQGRPFSVLDILSLLLECCIMVGLYSFVFKKTLATTPFWQGVFLIGVGLIVFEVLMVLYGIVSILTPLKISFFPTVALPSQYSIGTYILIVVGTLLLRLLVFILPPLYAVYQLAYAKKSKSRK